MGLPLVPEAAARPNLPALARTADEGGAYLLGIQDQPVSCVYEGLLPHGDG